MSARSKSRKRDHSKGSSQIRRNWGLWITASLAVAGLAYGLLRGRPERLEIPAWPQHPDPLVAAQLDQAASGVRENPHSGPAWGKLGMVLHAYLYAPQARQCFSNAGTLDGNEARWPYFEGLLLLSTDPRLGMDKLSRSVELAPSIPDTPRLHLAGTLVEHGRLDEARAHFQELLRRNQRHAPALIGLARIDDARGDYQAATEKLKRCLEDPFTAKSAYRLLSVVQQKAGNVPAAQTASKIADSLPPDQSWPEPFTDEIRRLQTGRAELVSRAERSLRNNDHAQAQSAIDQLLNSYAASPEGWLLAGRLKLEGKDCPGAEKFLRRHLQLAPESVNGNAQLGMALLCQERHSDAVPFFAQAVKLKPDYGEGHFNLGFALAKARQPTAAIPAFRNAIRCSPNYLESYILLGDLLSQAGQREEAVSILTQALKLNPADERAKFLLERIKAG